MASASPSLRAAWRDAAARETDTPIKKRRPESCKHSLGSRAKGLRLQEPRRNEAEQGLASDHPHSPTLEAVEEIRTKRAAAHGHAGDESQERAHAVEERVLQVDAQPAIQLQSLLVDAATGHRLVVGGDVELLGD